MSENELCEVLSTNDASQIAFIKSLLESEGVKYFIQGEIHSAIATRLPVRVMVPAGQKEKALEILRGFI
jgi:hypothetical protein